MNTTKKKQTTIKLNGKKNDNNLKYQYISEGSCFHIHPDCIEDFKEYSEHDVDTTDLFLKTNQPSESAFNLNKCYSVDDLCDIKVILVKNVTITY